MICANNINSMACSQSRTMQCKCTSAS
ncbi:hypothetical protein R5R35_010884 [Gryllus longicercus]|uniref:Uncharacterized protein n=1 Tax=Gryllus longicercus TaxID=2509291 RepID=A0AAN9Z167_9ORTH